MKNKLQTIIIGMVGLLVCSLIFGFQRQQNLSKLKLDLELKSLHKGKVITIKGQVYYRMANGKMVTRFTYPREIITLTNAQGEFKNYNVGKNEVTQTQGADFSSKQSFFHLFLAGKTLDMGLKSGGFNLSNTTIENGVVVTTWNAPKTNIDLGSVSFKLAHKNHLPIYMAVYQNDTVRTKTYYSKFTQIHGLALPLTITEIEYLSENDSIIMRKKYTNLKTNNEVENTYLDFEIPSSAKLIETERGFD